MKTYFTYEKAEIENKWSILYYGFYADKYNHAESIAKALGGYFCGMFNECLDLISDDENDGPEIKNGNSIILVKKDDHFIDLWQDGGQGYDMNHVCIPDTVRVRKIGFIVD